MDQLLSSPADCCRPCPVPTTTDIPGPAGPAGSNGTNGTNGINAYTTTTAAFTMPGEGFTVSVEVAQSGWAALGENVFVGDPGAAASGTFQVAAIPDGTHLTLLNIANTAGGLYTSNSAPGTVFPPLSVVSPSGLQGPAGAAGAGTAPANATYIVQVPDAALTNAQALSALGTGFMQSTTGTGVVSTVPSGIAAGGVAPNDGALTAGDAVFATASGETTKTAAQARTWLSLALGILDTNIPPVDQAPGFTAGQIVRATANGLQSISNATLLAQLGLGSLPGAMAIFQNQQASGVNGGSVTAGGSWELVPLNTLVVGSFGSIDPVTGIMTLPAGTYRAQWRCPACIGGKFQSRLFNVDAGSFIAYGTSVVSASSANMLESGGEARFTLASNPTQVQLQIRASVANLLTGFGEACGFGNIEVYQAVVLVKET